MGAMMRSAAGAGGGCVGSTSRAAAACPPPPPPLTEGDPAAAALSRRVLQHHRAPLVVHEGRKHREELGIGGDGLKGRLLARQRRRDGMRILRQQERNN